PHKYVIQATVLQNSWPLSESAWRFVHMLKEMEKNDLKVSNRPLSSPKLEKTPIPKQSSKPKVGKEKGAKEKEKGQESRLSRPPSQTFDLSKPHWTLRVVSDTFAAALQSRLAYLNSHAVKIAQPAGELNGGVNAEQPPDMGSVNNDQELLPPLTPNSLTDMVESEVNLTLEPPSLAYSREVIEPLDLTPFINSSEV
ncbi:androglobin-like isoform X19, partial [Biomphalaria pfeifferi]